MECASTLAVHGWWRSPRHTESRVPAGKSLAFIHNAGPVSDGAADERSDGDTEPRVGKRDLAGVKATAHVASRGFAEGEAAAAPEDRQRAPPAEEAAARGEPPDAAVQQPRREHAPEHRAVPQDGAGERRVLSRLHAVAQALPRAHVPAKHREELWLAPVEARRGQRELRDAALALTETDRQALGLAPT